MDFFKKKFALNKLGYCGESDAAAYVRKVEALRNQLTASIAGPR
jgi:hypothetical protein